MYTGMLILLGLAFTFGSTFYLLFNRRHRDVVLDRLLFRGRRESGADTPPRSLSPKKEDPENSTDPVYSNVFPPSRRFTLAEAAPDVVAQFPHTVGLLDATAEKPPLCLQLDVPFNQADPKALTPTDFTVEEIRALGDFPDYATLSGVPLPRRYPEFDLKKAIPRPYRPLRWGYHQTMSLTRIEPDWWLEVESSYEERIRQRKELFIKYGSSVLDILPGAELACKELMEMCLQFLCARYPQYFDLDQENMLFYNQILGTTSDLKNTPPLIIILNNVPEDFALMLRDPETGFYKFRAGVICSALGWNLGSKLGMRLHEIHAPIPDYKEKMQFSMDRYFARKPTDKAIQRGSWGLEVDQPLYMPPSDPHEKYRETQHDDLTLERCNLRVDWQTLRRLPLSGAIVFNFKALFTPVETFREEPFIPALMLKIIREGKRSIMEYKNTWHTEHRVVPALEQYAKEQVDKGLVPEDWQHHTLEESPFFPDWEEKWHRDQGF